MTGPRAAGVEQPDGHEWEPVIIEPRTPNTAAALLHHAHRGVACSACEMLELRKALRALAAACAASPAGFAVSQDEVASEPKGAEGASSDRSPSSALPFGPDGVASASGTNTAREAESSERPPLEAPATPATAGSPTVSAPFPLSPAEREELMQLLRDLLDAEWSWNLIPLLDWHQGKANAREAAQDKDRARDAIVAYVERLRAEAMMWEREKQHATWDEMARMENEDVRLLDVLAKHGLTPVMGHVADVVDRALTAARDREVR